MTFAFGLIKKTKKTIKQEVIMKLRKLLGILLFVLSFTFFACGDPLPLSDIVAARAAFDATSKVRADKFFPDEHTAISSDFNSLHSMIVEGAKFKRIEDSAKSITQRSNELYIKSLPLAAKESLDSAERLMEESVVVNADVFFREEFSEAQSLLQSATEQYENKVFEQAFENALKAEAQFRTLRMGSIARKGILKDAITEVNNILVEAAEYNSDIYAAEEVELALANLETARECYESLELKRGFAALEAARINADKALLLSFIGTSRDGLETARNAIDRAIASPRAAELSDGIDAAEELYQSALLAFEDNRFPESIDLSREAYQIAIFVTYGESDHETVVRSQDEDGNYVTYKVVRRVPKTDTLWGIAGRFYNNPRLWPKIFNSNRDIIKNPDLIFPGQVLRIPQTPKN